MNPTVVPPASTSAFIDLVKGSGIHPLPSLESRLSEIPDLPSEPHRVAELLVRKGMLTPFQAKQLLAGRHKGFRLGAYVIQDVLGQGGMGSVYLAEHATLRRRVALKVLHKQNGADPTISVERFLREARAAAALDHPNIVRIHDVGQQGEVHFLAMEHVEGQSLDRILNGGGTVSPSRAVGYVAQAAAGLQHAHEKGFVHRDIKPANLMLGADGTVKILDMGLARSMTNEEDCLTEVLDQGAVVGTADYISPEQAIGDGPVDIRADIYSLGATFFALVTGKPPFKGSLSQKLAQHQFKAAPDLAEQDRTFPAELAKVISKMLAKKREERYQTPAEVIEALAPWLSDDEEHKVVIGLSGTDQGSSGKLRETLASKRSRRTDTLRSAPPAAEQGTEPAETPEPVGHNRRKMLLLGVGGAFGALLLIGLIAFAVWPSSKPKTETVQQPPAELNPPQPPAQTSPNNTPAPTPKPNNTKTEPPKGIPPIAADPKPALPQGGVLIAPAGNARHIRTEFYEAVVDRDGWMPSLRIDGVEVLRANISVSRGVYFNTGITLPFEITQPTPSAIAAQCDKASIQYDFAPKKITYRLENKSDKAMPLYIVMDTSVTGLRSERSEWSKVPLDKNSQQVFAQDGGNVSTWYAGRAKFALTGGTKVWGPWQGKYQVWEAALPPGEKRTVTLEVGLTDAAEAAKLGEVTGVKPALSTPLTLETPADYQVFQRRTKLQGNITVRGRVRAAYDRLEARVVGKPLQGALPDQWRELPVADKGQPFEASVPAPAGGWYKVEVRALKDGKVVGQMPVDHVGVGEVFVGAGQSNSTNSGQAKLRQESGMVSSFSGTGWQLADDPQLGVHDNSAGGSFWPAFGDAMYEKYRVPIGIASTGHSGSSVSQWAPNGELCRWTTARIRQFGPNGFRAVLWHQGESDFAMSPDDYARRVTALIRETQKAAGWDAPWFVAQASYRSPEQTTTPNPRAGQKRLWESGVALEGPDTDALTGDNRDDGGKGIHLSPKGLQAHGKLWAQKIGAYLDKELTK